MKTNDLNYGILMIKLTRSYIISVHGNWGSWSEYGVCTKTCGGGSQKRLRSCNNPSPLHGGRQCDGQPEQSRSCGNSNCPGKLS